MSVLLGQAGSRAVGRLIPWVVMSRGLLEHKLSHSHYSHTRDE